MELKEAFEAADIDKGGSLEPKEVHRLPFEQTYSSIVRRGIRRSHRQRHERAADQPLVHEDRRRLKRMRR